MNVTKMKWCGLLYILVAMLFAMAILDACKGGFDRDDDDEGRPAQASASGQPPAQISFENGQAILTLDPQAQKRIGIQVSNLESAVTRPELDVPAVVLSAQELATIRNNYIALEAQLEKDRIQLDVARNEYGRLKALYDGNRDVSEKSLQAANGDLRSIEADQQAAEQQLNLQTLMAQQQWGSVVAKWTVDGAPDLGNVLDMHEALLQVTLPFDERYDAPRQLAIDTPNRRRTQADLVSPFPRVDPRIQGRSFLYITRTGTDFVPGVNLVAHLVIGDAIRGVTVPAMAVVWSNGKAWAYVQTAPNQFSRREVATDTPSGTGYFSAAAFSAGSKVVTQGAQSLLSEESILQGYGGGDTDDD